MIYQFLCYILVILSFAWPAGKQESYYDYTLENFRNAEPFLESIDLLNPDYPRLNAVIFYLTNEVRKKKKLNILQYEKRLEESASIHCNSMIEYSFFDHINPKSKELRSPNDRAKFAGIANPYLAENIIETFVLQYSAGKPVFTGEKGIFRYHQEDDAIKPHTYLSLGEALLEGWMNSSQHKENILSQQAVQLGCGTAFYLNENFNDMPTVIATQNFQLFESARSNP